MSDTEKLQSAATELRQAATAMSDAAEKMRQVLRDYDYTITCHQRFMSNWLSDLQESLQDLLPSEENPMVVKLLHEKDEAPLSSYPSDRPTMPVPFGGEELSD